MHLLVFFTVNQWAVNRHMIATVWVTKKFLFRFYKDGIYSVNGNGMVGTRHGPFNGELNDPFNG